MDSVHVSSLLYFCEDQSPPPSPPLWMMRYIDSNRHPSPCNRRSGRRGNRCHLRPSCICLHSCAPPGRRIPRCRQSTLPAACRSPNRRNTRRSSQHRYSLDWNSLRCASRRRSIATRNHGRMGRVCRTLLRTPRICGLSCRSLCRPNGLGILDCILRRSLRKAWLDYEILSRKVPTAPRSIYPRNTGKRPPPAPPRPAA